MMSGSRSTIFKMLSVPRLCGSLRVLVWAHLLLLIFPTGGIAQSKEPAFRDNFYDVVIRGDSAWIVGYYGTILASRDRGLTWKLQQSNTTEALFRVFFINEKKGWVTGSFGTILHTNDGGKSWHRQKSPVEENLLGLCFLDDLVGWAVGSRGTILSTEDGGATWSNRSIGEDVILNDVRFPTTKQGWVVGEFGRIYHTRDGGRRWRKQKSPIEVPFTSGSSRNLFRLLFRSPSQGWVFGLDGVILTTTDGEAWNITRSDGAPGSRSKPNHLFAAAVIADKIWAVGERGTVLVSGLRKDVWLSADFKTPPRSLNAIAAGSRGLGLIIGNRGVILRTEDDGKQWKTISLSSRPTGSTVKTAQ